jgi:hypothetical protein
MSWTPEEFRVLFSENLLKENLDGVIKEIQLMQGGHGMIAEDHADTLLQGDVFDGVPCVQRHSQALAIAPRRVIMVSNSCDADAGNPRPIPLDITVAPVLRLSRYQEMLLANGVEQPKVEDIVRSIKRQEKTNLVYLPVGGKLPEEMVVLLDQIQSLPSKEFQAANTQRLAVLTQRGFWLFLVKLSMHFLRPHEGVDRQAA